MLYLSPYRAQATAKFAGGKLVTYISVTAPKVRGVWGEASGAGGSPQ